MSAHNNHRPRPSRVPSAHRRQVEIEEWRESLIEREGGILGGLDEMTARHLAGVCNAAPRGACTTPDGLVLPYVHQERIIAARTESFRKLTDPPTRNRRGIRR